MPSTLAFDVYGTLIDTHGVVAGLQSMMGDKANGFSQAWRDKQLEYSFRRGLMQNYASFAQCTRDALDYCCHRYGLTLSETQKQTLMGLYKTLPAFEDAKKGLEALMQSGVRMYAFSNGSAEAVEGLLRHAGLRDFFLDVVSTEELCSFKPNPGVYSHFLRRTKATGDQAWLISSNPFDVIGAVSAGWRAAWVQRTNSNVFDPWGIEPTVTIKSLSELANALKT